MQTRCASKRTLCWRITNTLSTDESVSVALRDLSKKSHVTLRLGPSRVFSPGVKRLTEITKTLESLDRLEEPKEAKKKRR